MKPYFFGTGITLEKLCQICRTRNIDGTTYKTEEWLAEVDVMANLKIGDPVWIPYGGAEVYGTLKEVVWNKYEFKHYIDTTGRLHGYPIEALDWWFYEPHMKVDITIDGEYRCYYVYEYTFYKEQKHKERDAWNRKIKQPKRKFHSMALMGDIKKWEAIENSVKKRYDKISKL
jgi:hypothetical protein